MELTQEFKEAYASIAKDPTKREALASLLVEYIQPNHLSSNIVSLFLNTRNLKPGDALVKKVRKGITVRKLVPGSIHLASELAMTDRINYTLEGADVKVTYNAWELDSGEIGSIDSIQAEMQAKLTDYYVNRVFTALTTVWTASNTPTNYATVSGTLTSTALKNAIDTINQKVGRVRAVVGTRKALTPITTFGAGWALGGGTEWGLDQALTEIYQTGWLGRYYGAPIVALDQIYDNLVDYNPMLPEDKVVVLGENAGDFIFYGDVKSKAYDNMEPTPPQFVLELYQQFGMIIDNAQGIYIIKIV